MKNIDIENIDTEWKKYRRYRIVRYRMTLPDIAMSL